MADKPSTEELWETISKKAWDSVDFFCITTGQGVELTEEERDAVQLGIASGITATLEHFKDRLRG